MQPASETSTNSQPLAVDLDGTLIRTDMLWESLVQLLRQRPLLMLAVPFWWVRGRPFLKRQIASAARVDVTTLPYNEAFLDWLKRQRACGRKLVLASASDFRLAKDVAEHVGLFDEVLASDGKTNLRDREKRKLLTAKFGERGYVYAGNSRADLDVWAGAKEAIVVNGNARLVELTGKRVSIACAFPATGSPVKAFLRALRPHQWTKNLVVFVPAITAHQFTIPAVLHAATTAFLAFCCCASAAYLLNDLLDLNADRQHAIKRNRPFASGELPLATGMIAVPVLLFAGLGTACTLPLGSLLVLAGYFAATVWYSWHLKRIPLLDVFFLAGLYTSRLIVGHLATALPWSAWLLVFSMFIFLSLALVKRFQELYALSRQDGHEVAGRGYLATDLGLVAMLGVASGFIAVLVLALYVNSEQVLKLYAHPTLLLLACPLLLYWLSRIWFLAHRGEMHDDPTAFAWRDPVSYIVGAITLAIMWLATGQ